MPKLTCRCGERVDQSPIPNHLGFKLVWEPRIELLIERFRHACAAAQSQPDAEQAAYAALADAMLPEVYECPNCGRLAVFGRASDTIPTAWYQPDAPAGAAPPSLRELAADVGASGATQRDDRSQERLGLEP